MAKKRSKQRNTNSGGGYKSQARKNQQRFSVAFAVILSVAMVASLLLPLFSQGFANQAATIIPTETPAPTLPPPPATESISFDDTYLHPSGLFTVQVPSGWEATNSNTTSTEAQAQLENADIQSVIELRMIEPGGEESYEDADSLRSFFTDNWLNASWRNYTGWNKDTETVEDDQLITDFSMTQGDRRFIARQNARVEDGRIYVTRVITLPNASDTLRYVLENVMDSFEPNDIFFGSPIDWTAYFDTEDRHVVRYPQGWTLTDAAPGRPATVSSDGVSVRIETTDEPVADEAAAEALVAGQRTGTEVTGVSTLERDGYSGFDVSYQYRTLDGEVETGRVLILNNDEQSHLVNLRVDGDVDLNAETAPEAYPDVLAVLNSFTLMPDLNVVQVEGE